MSVASYRESISDKKRRLVRLKRRYLQALCPGEPLKSYVPNPKQNLLHEARGDVLFVAGNRAGKTTAGAMESAMRLTGEHWRTDLPQPPVHGRGISAGMRDGVSKILVPALREAIPPRCLVKGSWDASYNAQSGMLRLTNGSTMDLMSFDQPRDRFAGVKRHFIWFDEEPGQEVFTENRTRLVDLSGDWFLTMTPIDGMTWTYRDLYEPAMAGGATTCTVVEATMWDNISNLPAEEVERFASELGEEERQIRIFGRYVATAGLVYPEFSDQRHVVEPFEIPAHWKKYRGLDYNYVVPCGCVWWAVDERGHFYAYREYYEPLKTPEQAARDIRALEGNEQVQMTLADPTLFNETGRPTIADLFRQGGVNPHEGSRDSVAGRAYVRRALATEGGTVEPRLHVFSTCINLIHEFRGYRQKKSLRPEATGPLDEPVKVNDHLLDATRYFFTWWHTESPEAKKPPEVGAGAAKTWQQVWDSYEKPGNWKRSPI